METLTITKPDDCHLHLRDGKLMSSVVNHSAARFARAIIMPNLTPPVVNTEMALAYRDRILESVDDKYVFEPLMTLYLTDNTSTMEIKAAANSRVIKALKYYPVGVTTNSDQGVTDIKRVYPVLDAMMRHNLCLLVHGEISDNGIDIFDREAVFIDKVLSKIVKDFTELKIIFEHITTRTAVDFVLASSLNVAATITPQHILLNRNALFKDGIRPHNYCLPVLKREDDRKAVLTAATSGSPKFFLGTDSAPHARHTKENDCGCAGIYSAHIGLELYAEAFDIVGQLSRLESFASYYGADFYGLPRNTEQITLAKKNTRAQKTIPFGDTELIPFRSGENCVWQIIHESS